MAAECCACPWPATLLCGHARFVVACANCGHGDTSGDHHHIEET